jgi:nucleotide-binding universal stress UspA family protein
MSQSAGTQQRIVVGVDGSEAATVALGWAVEEARWRSARLEAVIAWRPTATIAPPAGHAPPLTRTVEERHADAKAILELALREVDTSGVELERRIMRGTPHRVLVEAAAGADLLVIGGRSSRLTSKLPWATGQQVVDDASCPVAVVPPAWARRAQASDARVGTAAPVL